MSWRLKIALWVLLGFVLGVTQTWWERGSQAAAPEPARPVLSGTTLV